jgi:phenylpyruvate tautomerase PptA (4-oxalocrotonate tautomerase family)
MPYIDVKLSVKLDEDKKNDVQAKLTDAVSSAFSKPKMYIMANIQDGSSLYMGAGKVEKGAYIQVSLLGSTTKSACQNLTKDIFDILHSELGLDGSKVYVTYHSVDLWAWNGSMF